MDSAEDSGVCMVDMSRVTPGRVAVERDPSVVPEPPPIPVTETPSELWEDPSPTNQPMVPSTTAGRCYPVK